MVEKNIQVLVVDDQALIRKAISGLLKNMSNIEVIAEAASGEEALQLVQQHQPHVVLMDIRMPGMGGLEASQKIMRLYPQIKIIALTAYEDDVYPLRFLESGTAGYITKGSTAEELELAVRTVFLGRRYLSPTIAQKLALKKVQARGESPFDQLSKRELQIAMMIVTGQRPREIAQIFHLSPKTVNTYRYRIFEKLGIENDVELALLAKNFELI